jgi:hypothetical protein
MSYSYAAPVTGVVTQAATAATINIPVPGFGDILKFEIWDETQFGLTSSNTDMLAAWWYKDMLAGSAFVQNRVSGQATAITTNMVLTNGFTLVDPTGPELQAQKTGTTITSADPAVATVTSHGFSNGDVVRITNSTGLLQIAGWDFTIAGVTTNTFTLANLDTTLTNLTSGASAFKVQKLNYGAAYYPSRKRITNIGTASSLGVSGAGSSSIITMAVTHGFTVGQAVRIYVPNAFIGSGTNVFVNPGILGTSSTSAQIVAATITAINTADASSLTNTITVNINSTGTTFQWPTSATAASGVSFPFVEPVGEAATTSAGTVNPANLLDDATRNTGNYIMSLGSNVYGVASDVIRWFAWRGAVNS